MAATPQNISEVIARRRSFAVLGGDCLDLLRKIPSGCADSVITDPPYGMNYRGLDDKQKPIANDDHPFVWWLYDARRILKEGGALICFCQWKGQDQFRLAIEMAGFSIRSQVIWKRAKSGMGNTACTFAPVHDVIWFATKGRFTFPAGRPISVLDVPNVPTLQRVHSTQKPEDLMGPLVEKVTPAGGLVVDPCMGSGSTGAAAVAAGYRFLGIELDPDHCKTARWRIEAAARSITTKPGREPKHFTLPKPRAFIAPRGRAMVLA